MLVVYGGSGCVFFQSEDGIRYLVRSRGLGDVYKRQGLQEEALEEAVAADFEALSEDAEEWPASEAAPAPVSYTHLTLPTSDLV